MSICNHCCFGIFILFMLGVVNLWLYFNDNNENNYVVLIIAILFMTIPTLIYSIYYYLITYKCLEPIENKDYFKM